MIFQLKGRKRGGKGRTSGLKHDDEVDELVDAFDDALKRTPVRKIKPALSKWNEIL